MVGQGFYENGEFEVSTIHDHTTDQIIRLRDEYGKHIGAAAEIKGVSESKKSGTHWVPLFIYS